MARKLTHEGNKVVSLLYLAADIPGTIPGTD
jgi:hypothetical protein